MNLKQLKVFRAVAETASFSQGAEASFITQSTVSLHISSLEKEFGVRLFDRTGKGALLTPGGKVLLHQARILLAEAQNLSRTMNQFRGVEDTTLCIGGSNIPGDYIIPEILAVIIKRFPSLTISMSQGDSQETLSKIRREEIELGIVGSWFDDDLLNLKPLGQDQIRLVVGEQHHWCGVTAVSIHDLQHETFILREEGSGTMKTVGEALISAGMPLSSLNIKIRLGSNEAIKQAVLNGLGISFLSETSIRKELARGELTALDIRGVNLSRHFYLAQRQGRELSPAAQTFKAIAIEMFGSGAGNTA